MARTLVPYGARLLVRPTDPVSRTAGGIVIPDKAQKMPTTGEVVAVGRGDFDMMEKPLSEVTWPDGAPIVPRVGDTIWFSKYGGTEIRFEDQDLVILHLKDVLGIVQDGG